MTSPDRFEDQLRKVLAGQAGAVGESRIAAVAGRDYAPRTRRRVIPLLCAGAVAVVAVASAAVAVVLLPGPGRAPGTARAAGGRVGSGGVAGGPAAVGGTMELAGYRLTFPAGYRLGRADTDCTENLQLSASETSRRVTTPEPGCPLVVTSVARSLPSATDRSQLSEIHYVSSGGVRSGSGTATTVALYVAGTGTAHPTTYVPARLPDGSTVYVTLAGPPSGLEIRGGSGTAYSLAQLAEFEQGVDVSPR